VVHESSVDAQTSSDDELNENLANKGVLLATQRMMKSNDKTDERFINMFRIMQEKKKERG